MTQLAKAETATSEFIFRYTIWSKQVVIEIALVACLLGGWVLCGTCRRERIPTLEKFISGGEIPFLGFSQ